MSGGDPFTSHPFRLLGYSGGFANALSPPLISGHACKALHSITAGFILCHTVYKPVVLKNGSAAKMLVSAGDTFVYEALASGLFPPVAAKIMHGALSKGLAGPLGSTGVWISSAVTCSVLVLACPVVDNAINKVMDLTIRKVY